MGISPGVWKRIWTKGEPFRGYMIEHDPKPIPWRGDDWNFVHEDYDGPGDRRCGTSASPEACMAEIDMLEDDDS